eukprot:scaffold41838_cov60-Phaeocystis_antarctica.AAC.2
MGLQAEAHRGVLEEEGGGVEQALPQHEPPSQQQQGSEALAQRPGLNLAAAAQRRSLAVVQKRRVHRAEVALGRL